MTKYVCTICGYVAEGKIPDICPVCKAPAAKFAPKEVEEAPAVEAAPVKKYVCTVCGDRKDQQEVPPLGHDFVETGRTEPGEDGTPGYIEYTCSRCGEQKQEPIPAVNAGWLPRRRRLPDYAMTGARYER